ncbi:unnamed protein product, partial [Tetraodon nigroviridis]
ICVWSQTGSLLGIWRERHISGRCSPAGLPRTLPPQHGGSPSRCFSPHRSRLKCGPLNYLSFGSDHPIYLGLLH